jgi:hypothetical protein
VAGEEVAAKEGAEVDVELQLEISEFMEEFDLIIRFDGELENGTKSFTIMDGPNAGKTFGVAKGASLVDGYEAWQASIEKVAEVSELDVQRNELSQDMFDKPYAELTEKQQKLIDMDIEAMAAPAEVTEEEQTMIDKAEAAGVIYRGRTATGYGFNDSPGLTEGYFEVPFGMSFEEGHLIILKRLLDSPYVKENNTREAVLAKIDEYEGVELAQEVELEFEEDVEEKPAPQTVKGLSLGGSSTIGNLSNKAELIEARDAIKQALGARVEISGRDFLPVATIEHLLANPAGLGKLKPEWVNLLLERAKIYDPKRYDSIKTRTETPSLSDEALLSELISVIYNEAAGYRLSAHQSALADWDFRRTEGIAEPEAAEPVVLEEPEVKTPEQQGREDAAALSAAALSPESELKDVELLESRVRDILMIEYKAGNIEYVKAFLTHFGYGNVEAFTATELRDLAPAAIASKITVGVQAQALKGAAGTETKDSDKPSPSEEQELTEDVNEDPNTDEEDALQELEDLVTGTDNSQFVQQELKFANETRALFAAINLKGTFGPSVIMDIIRTSKAIRRVLELGSGIEDRFLYGEITAKERAAEIKELVGKYMEYGAESTEEQFLINAIQTAGLKPLKVYDALHDLTTRFHASRTRPALKVVASFNAERQLTLKFVPYASETTATMQRSLASVMAQKLATQESALKFFKLIEAVANMGEDQLYVFWEMMLSEPAAILENADVKHGDSQRHKWPHMTAAELGPLYTLIKGRTKNTWPRLVEEFRKEVAEATDGAAYRALVPKMRRKFMFAGLAQSPSRKSRGMTDLARIAKAMPNSEAPTSYRRADGTQRSNIHAPDQVSQMLELEREAGTQKDIADVPGVWEAKEMDMINANTRGGKRVIPFENLSQEEHARIHQNRWLQAWKQERKVYDAWAGPIGDKTTVRTVAMPLFQTLEEARQYYEDTIADKGDASVLTQGERHPDFAMSVEDIFSSHDYKGLSERGIEILQIFELTDRANRLRILHAIHGNFSKFGDATMITKRSSSSGSSGLTLTEEAWGDSKVKAVRLKDPAFLTTALQLAIDEAKAAFVNAKTETAKQRAKATLDRVQAQAEEFLSKIESTDGHALFMPQARDRMEKAYGPLLTQTDKFGKLKVFKTIHTGHVGLDKQGASVLSPSLSDYADGSSAYNLIFNAVVKHLKQMDPTMSDEVARMGGRGENRIDMILFSSGDKAKTGNEVELTAGTVGQAEFRFPETSLADLPIRDFYWLLSAGHHTQASPKHMPVQAVAAMSGLPGVFQDLHALQRATVEYASRTAGKSLAPRNLLEKEDHPMVPFALKKHVPFDNVFTAAMLSKKQTIKLSKITRPVAMMNQLVEVPVAAPPNVLMDYHKVSESGDGLYDADSKGTKVRLARADFNSNGVRFSLTLNEKEMTARTVAEAEALLRDPDVIPMVLDMFEISREDLRQLRQDMNDKKDGMTYEEQIAAFYADIANNPKRYPLRTWELETDADGFIVVPGEPVLIERVPSDALYSTSMVRAGRRLVSKDGESPNIIMTSQGVQLGSGADFDIDKRYTMSMRRSAMKSSDLPEGSAARRLAERTYVKDVELDQEKTNIGYDLMSRRWSAYNRALLGMTLDFGKEENFDLITAQLDHDLNKPLVDKAKAEHESRDREAGWDSDFASVFGAARMYKLNSVGKKGLGRSATSMFAAGVMHGMGYGVVKDASFEFTTPVPGSGDKTYTGVIKVNRLAGDRSNFAVARNSIGLVMNQFTDHTKMQVIDKLGGDEYTASLFAALYYLNADLTEDRFDETTGELIPDPNSVSQYGETIWRALESPEIQAWAGLQRLKDKLDLSVEEAKILRMVQESDEQLPEKALHEMHSLMFPDGGKPNTRLWSVVVQGAEEMLQIERLFRGYRNPLPTDSVTMFNRRQAAINRAIGLGSRVKKGKTWYGVPALFQHPKHANDAAQTAMIQDPFGYISKYGTAKAMPMHFRPTFLTMDIALKHVAGMSDMVYDKDLGEVVRLDMMEEAAPTHRLVFEEVIPILKSGIKMEVKVAPGIVETWTADLTPEGMRRAFEESNRVVFATALLQEYDETPTWQSIASGLQDKIDAALRTDEHNKFLTEGMAPVSSANAKIPKFEVPSNTAGYARSAEELAEFHESFRALPEDLKLDLLTYAVLKYGIQNHTGFGSYLEHIDPQFIAPFVARTDEINPLDFHINKIVRHIVRAANWTDPGNTPLNTKIIADTTKAAKRVTTEVTSTPAREGMPRSLQMILADAELMTPEQAEVLEHEEYEGTLPVKHHKIEDYDFDYELHGVSKADWETYFEYRHTPTTAATVGSWTIYNFRAAQAAEMRRGDEQIRDWFKEEIQPMLTKEWLSTEERRKEVAAIIRGAADTLLKKIGDNADFASEIEAVTSASIAFALADPAEMTALRSVIKRVQAAVKQKKAVAQETYESETAESLAGEANVPAEEIREIVDGDTRNPDDNLRASAFFTHLIEVDASNMSGNQQGRTFLLKHTRAAEAIHVLGTEGANKLFKMTGSRSNSYDKVGAERPGEALLKAISVLFEAGIHTEEDLKLAELAQLHWDKYPSDAKKRPEYEEFMAKHPGTTRIGELYYWDDPNDVVKHSKKGKTWYSVPKNKRKYVGEVLDAYKGERTWRLQTKKRSPLSHWTEAMSVFAKLHEDTVAGLNKAAGFEMFRRHENRAPHVLHRVDRGGVRAPNMLGEIEEGTADSYFNTSSYMELMKQGNLPRSFNAAENYVEWLNSATQRARVVGVLRSSALMVDPNGVPGMILGSAETQAGEKLTPYDRTAGFVMLKNLRKKLAENKAVELPRLNTSGNPWRQASELAAKYPDAMKGLGYVEIKSHALGPNIDTLWAVQGTLDKVAKHVSYSGIHGRLQQAKADEATWRTAGWRAAYAALKITQFFKLLNVSISAFHTLALAESAVANAGMSFKAPIFHIGTYIGAGIKGIKMYRHLTRDPEMLAKWTARGLKAHVVPLDAVQIEMRQNFLSWSGHQIRNGWLSRRKLGRGISHAAGDTVLAMGNVMKSLDNLLWHGIVPTMKVHMAEQMFEAFRADPKLAHLSDEEIGHDVAKYTNDALGTQQWEQYLFMNPLMQDFANMLWFAPDWTLSALNVSGLSRAMGEIFGADGPIEYSEDLFNITNSKLIQHRLKKYLPGFILNVLVMPPIVIQAAIFMMFGGDEDEGDEMFPWLNEDGKFMRIDFTPLLRAHYRAKGIEYDGRRAYWTTGKQLREVVGWLRHPAQTSYGKSSNVVRMSNLMLFGLKSSPFVPDPWKVERDEILQEVVYSMMPFTLSGYFSDPEVPWYYRLAMPLPVTRGASTWKLSQDTAALYLQAAMDTRSKSVPWWERGKRALEAPLDIGYHDLTRREKVKKLNREFDKIRKRAIANQLDPRTVQIEGRKTARAVLNSNLMDEMTKTKPDGFVVQDYLVALAVLEPNYGDRLDSLSRSVKYRVKKSAKLRPDEKERLQKLYDSFKFRAWIRRATDSHIKAWGTGPDAGVTLDDEMAE